VIFLCESCYTFSFESNTPLHTKNFTLSAEGVPRPCCPACLQSASSDCASTPAKMRPSRHSAPVPYVRSTWTLGQHSAAVADYLKTRVADKLFVTFDYELVCSHPRRR
jgi:hypothetical protein